MMMFDDKVGGWGWLNDNASKKYTRKRSFVCVQRKECWNFLKIFFFWKDEPELVCWVFSIKTSPV